MNKAYIALGANLGEAKATLEKAVKTLDALASVSVIAQSQYYKTAPVDSSGPDYVNGVCQVQTTLTPEALLRALLAIEAQFGRERPEGVVNAPRTLDLDLLTYEDEVRQSDFLTLPHPRMEERLFVLIPLADIAPNWTMQDGSSIQERIEAIKLKDTKQAVLAFF